MLRIGRRQLLLAGGSALLVACTPGVASGSAAPSAARPSSPLAANRALGVWPDLVAKAPLAVRQAYEYAASNQQILQFVPCYCGCGSIGHEDNLSCFVAQFAQDGWLVLDPHATACNTCVGIALEAMSLEKQGVTVKDIRRSIDEKWSKVGPGTSTRMP